MSTAVDLVDTFARLQATDDAQATVRMALEAISLPQCHPLSNSAPLGDGKDTLILIAQIKAGMDVARMGWRLPSWEAQFYTAAYIKQFLVAIRQELLTRLWDTNLALRGEEEALAETTIQSLDEVLLSGEGGRKGA